MNPCAVTKLNMAVNATPHERTSNVANRCTPGRSLGRENPARLDSMNGINASHRAEVAVPDVSELQRYARTFGFGGGGANTPIDPPARVSISTGSVASIASGGVPDTPWILISMVATVLAVDCRQKSAPGLLEYLLGALEQRPDERSTIEARRRCQRDRRDQ